jgi:hypothetical protein
MKSFQTHQFTIECCCVRWRLSSNINDINIIDVWKQLFDNIFMASLASNM